MSWEVVAREKSGKKYLYRHSGTDIFEVRSIRYEDQLFHIENPNHEIFNQIIEDFPPQMTTEAIQAIERNQTERYDQLDVSEGFVVVDGEKIDVEMEDITQEEANTIIVANEV